MSCDCAHDKINKTKHLIIVNKSPKRSRIQYGWYGVWSARKKIGSTRDMRPRHLQSRGYWGP